MSNLTYDEAVIEISAKSESDNKTMEIALALSRIINELSEARVKSGMSQRQLAEKCGLKQSAIARMESLQVVPRLDTVLRVAVSLGVEIRCDLTTPIREISDNVVNFDDCFTAPTSERYSWPGIAASETTNIYTKGALVCAN